MSHKFNEKQKEKLNNPNRRKMLPPKETLLQLDLNENDLMADIGCGIGYFTFPASEIVGAGGVVYAMDISASMLEDVAHEKAEIGADNVEIMEIEENNFKLPDQSVTYGFICNVLHEAHDKKRFLDETARIMKEDGRVVIIEWEKKIGKPGPDIHHRIDKEEVEKILREIGFNTIIHGNISPDLYSIVASK